MAARAGRYVLYQWLAEKGYFLQAILEDFSVIDARVDDSPERILEHIPPDTASFAFHLNCTITHRFPQRRRELIEALGSRGISVLNAMVTDISKEHIQSTCAALRLSTTTASISGPPDERIIVKTNLNYGGDSEWALSAAERVMLGIDVGSDIIWQPDNYRVVPREDVEASWWTDRRLICERFIVNREGLWYRAFVFLGRIAIAELVSDDAIKKVGGSRVRRVWMSDAEASDATLNSPATSLLGDLRRFIRAFHLDCGAVDLVADDEGRHYIIDVNTTPAYNHPIEGIVQHMRGALAA